MHALGIHDPGIPLGVHIAGGAHEVDEAVGKTNGGIFDGLPSTEVGSSTENEDALGLRSAWSQVGLGQGRDRKAGEDKEERRFHGGEIQGQHAVHRFSSVMVSQW